MLLAVVGSTNINQEQINTAKAIIQGMLMFYMPELVISGGAVGIDSLAEEEALLFNLDFIKYKPENFRWKPDGFMDRNLKIAKHATHLLCIRTTQSTTYGSGWTADRAEEMGKPVWRVTI